MDGTLVDTEHVWLQGEIATMASLGASWSPADQAVCLGGPLERVADYMVDLSGTLLTSQQVGQRLLSNMEILFRAMDPVWQPGARELLTEAVAAEIPTALVSASWRVLMVAITDAIDRELGSSPFTVTVAGDEVSRGKPHADPYLQAAEALGVAIGDCVVIEDSPTGVAAGQASGAVVVAVPHIAPVQPHSRTIVVETLDGVDLARIRSWMSASEQDSLG